MVPRDSNDEVTSALSALLDSYSGVGRYIDGDA